MFQRHQAETTKDQAGHRKFLSHPNIHRILRFTLNDAERTFKCSQSYKIPKIRNVECDGRGTYP